MSGRCVRFSKDLCQMFLVDNDDRKGPWEECARDRFRFWRRILETQTVLNPILNHDRRRKVYESISNEELKAQNQFNTV